MFNRFHFHRYFDFRQSLRVMRMVLPAMLLLCGTLLLFLCTGTNAARADDNNFLQPDVAFRFSATEQPGEIDVHYRIADGYYMYRERFSFAARNSNGNVTFGKPRIPVGHIKFDPTFQKNVEIWRGDVTIRIPVKHAASAFDLAVTSQGCADAGLCYPPMERVYHVEGAALHVASAASSASSHATSAPSHATSTPLPAASAPLPAASALHTASVPPDATTVPTAPPESARSSPHPSAPSSWYERATNADYAQSLLQGGGFLAVVGLYFIAGMVLSLLPCSYPMIPILSAIIVGEGARITRMRGFALSFVYVLGMALVYTVLGVAAALVGQSLGTWLQNPWVLGAFALLLTVLALLLIAGVDIALPQAWQNGAARVSQKRRGGKFVAVGVMGALSALVVGACMTAPLFAVLAFVAHTGNAVLGAAALFAMGLGLGVPLMILGMGAGALLPRAGAWMAGVKVFFGVMLLAAALWIVWPVLGGVVQMLLAALWLLLVAATLGLFTPHHGASTIWRRLGRGIGAALAIWATILLVGLAAGSTDPLRPLALLASPHAEIAASSPDAQVAPGSPAFMPVHSSAQFDAALHAAGKPVMLDFYADWCVSCKEMEKFTFSNPRVRAKLAQLALMRADVTANTPDDQALLKRFGLFGPPGILFFDAAGHETMRVEGYESADQFLQRLDQLSAVARR